MDNSREAVSTGETETTQRGRARGCGCLIAIVLFLLAGAGATAFLGGTFALRQKSVLEPEAVGADLAKRWLAVPAEFTDWQMPAEARDPKAVAAGREIFATECGMCHGQDGRKVTTLGATMFPPAVDLSRDRTQSKTDGQLYWLIFHGINYTGMPGWGDDPKIGGSHNQAEIWQLVSYVRSLKTK